MCKKELNLILKVSETSSQVAVGFSFLPILFYLIFLFQYPPSYGIATCVGTAGTVQTPTLDAAVLSSSRAGADLCRTSYSRE